MNKKTRFRKIIEPISPWCLPRNANRLRVVRAQTRCTHMGIYITRCGFTSESVVFQANAPKCITPVEPAADTVRRGTIIFSRRYLRRRRYAENETHAALFAPKIEIIKTTCSSREIRVFDASFGTPRLNDGRRAIIRYRRPNSVSLLPPVAPLPPHGDIFQVL